MLAVKCVVMTITLGSNLASLRGQRQLAKTSTALSAVFERLSSGQRINRASDDAAGLAISDSLRADSRVFNQGVRNLNDGLSLLNIADQAVENLSTIIIRLEELAEQAANGIYGSQQRAALDAEAQALSDEFLRISRTTEFNGLKLFTGENHTVSLQAGIGTDAILHASVGGAIGTGSFLNETAYATGSGPFEMITGDFNSDGHADVVTVDRLDATVSLLLGDGAGGLSAARSFTVGANATYVTTGDLNNDGNLDLVSADRDDNTVSVLLGDGAGSFSDRTILATGTRPNHVEVGDLNGDGILDIVTSDYIDNVGSIFIGDGQGGFSARSTVDLGTAAWSVSLADVNEDGNLDLISTEINLDTIGVLLGDGSGSFGTKTTFAVGDRPFKTKIADINGDGHLDVLSNGRNDDTLNVLLGDGTGSFGSNTSFAVGSGPNDLDIGDVNGDGFIDVALSHASDDTIQILLGDGAGGFSAESILSIGSGPRSVSLDDFNGDGVLDVVGTSYDDNAVNLLLAETVDGISPILNFSLRSIADARQALPEFQRKRDQLTAQRGDIGAKQARIEVAINVLTVSSDNFRAAESRIRDTDTAEEAAKLTLLNIRQQAASAILAQANQQPALAVSLLG